MCHICWPHRLLMGPLVGIQSWQGQMMEGRCGAEGSEAASQEVPSPASQVGADASGTGVELP